MSSKEIKQLKSSSKKKSYKLTKVEFMTKAKPWSSRKTKAYGYELTLDTIDGRPSKSFIVGSRCIGAGHYWEQHKDLESYLSGAKEINSAYTRTDLINIIINTTRREYAKDLKILDLHSKVEYLESEIANLNKFKDAMFTIRYIAGKHSYQQHFDEVKAVCRLVGLVDKQD